RRPLARLRLGRRPARAPMRRFPWELAAIPALALARVLPEHGVGLGLRLAAATLCLLLPGALIARALGRSGPSAAVAWSLAGIFGAAAVMFAAGGSLWLALGLYGGVALVAFAFSLRGVVTLPAAGTGLVLVLG